MLGVYQLWETTETAVQTVVLGVLAVVRSHSTME